MPTKAQLPLLAAALAIASSCVPTAHQRVDGTGGASAGLGGAGGSGPTCTGTDADTTGEFNGCACVIPVMPAYGTLQADPMLPDPFLSMSGSRIANLADWTCRRAETKAQIENFELGAKPPKPAMVSGSVTNTSITVNAGDGTSSVAFTASVSLPPAGSPPYPAIIGYIGGSLNPTAVKNLGVAIINFNNDDLGAQSSASSRGQGKFYTLYGASNKASSMIAWAWGVSRIMDVLSQSDNTVIDAKHVGVTGCSRDGKGALVAGAFDERIALTIPQESGSGGTATWRISDFQKSQGENVQTLSEITGENDWFTGSFAQFNKHRDQVAVRPPHADGHGRAARFACDRQHRHRLADRAQLVGRRAGGADDLSGARRAEQPGRVAGQPRRPLRVPGIAAAGGRRVHQEVPAGTGRGDGRQQDRTVRRSISTQWIDWTAPALQ